MAVRINNIEMVYSLLHLIEEDVISYDVLKEFDTLKRNVLHYAVINQNKELITILVLYDADKQELRS
jgi:hypothetical protein